MFHMRCLRRILGITWQDKVTNEVVLEKAGIPSLYSLKARAHAMARTCDTGERWQHSKRPFIWRTGDREKTNRTTPTTLQGCMQVRPPGTWHKQRLLGSYCHRQRWRHTIKVGLSQYEETQRVNAEEKRLHKKTACLANRPTTPFTCSKCDMDCHSRIGLHSHNRRCTMGANLWSFETDRCQ